METHAKPATKSEIVSALSEQTGLSKKDVTGLFDGLNSIIKRELGKKGPGIITIPGLVKLKVVHKPAQPERVGINPFTKQEQVFKAKPARRVVKAQAVKALKDMAAQ